MSEPRGVRQSVKIEITSSLTERFWRRVGKDSRSECWEWQGATRQGYGAIKHQGRVLGTHVISFVIHNGQVPPGRIVTHNCDNRLCVNPDHLVAGTHQSNALEMQERRKISVDRGTAVPNAVLNDETVGLILALHVAEGLGAIRLARKLGLNRHTVEGVIHRKRWTHVPMPSSSQAKRTVEALP